jgi:hypothetical protein
MMGTYGAYTSRKNYVYLPVEIKTVRGWKRYEARIAKGALMILIQKASNVKTTTHLKRRKPK